jgi:hypothetical protein
MYICLLFLSIDLYSPKASPVDTDGQYEAFNNEDAGMRNTHERLSQLFQELNRE